MTTDGGEPQGAPEAEPGRPRPEHPDFHRIVLEHAPAPILVADGDGVVRYANRATRETTGYADPVDTVNVLDGVDPADLDDALATFAAVVSEGEPHFETDRPWAPYEFRMIQPDGTRSTVTVTGAADFGHPVVGGVIYHLQPVPREDLLRRVLRGFSMGSTAEELFRLVTQMVALPPLDLESAVVARRVRGPQVRAATGDALAAALDRLLAVEGDGGWPWADAPPVPVHHAVAELAEPARSIVGDAGFVDLWVTGLHPGGDDSGHRLLAACTYHRWPAGATQQRLAKTRDLAEVVLTRTRLDDQLRVAARTDALTGLANRSSFFGRLGRAPDTDAGTTIGILYVDLDGFKQVNDRDGHAAGDRVLVACASRLRAVVGPDDLAARLGGDEFAVIAPGASVEHLRSLGDRIVHVLTAPIDLDGAQAQVGASVGGAVGRAEDPADGLVERADRAMYEAKRSGGGRVVVAG